MKLKTYTAESMAQALAHVRKDLGKDAMILHTRSFRVGSWFGFGGKTMVEITASSPAISSKPQTPRAMPRVARQQAPAQLVEPKPTEPTKPAQRMPEPEMVIQRGQTVTRQRLAHAGAPGQVSSPSLIDEACGLNGRDVLLGESQAPARSPRPVISPSGLSSGAPESSTPPRLTAHPVASAMLTRSSMGSEKPSAEKPASESGRLDAQSAAKVTPPPTQSNAQSNAASESVPAADPMPQPVPQTNSELKAQIDTLSKMMGQVLESTRKTAVAVGSRDPQAALPTGEMPGPLFTLYAQMLDNDVPVEQADRLIGSVRDRLDAVELKDPAVVRQAVLCAIESTIRIRGESLLTLAPNLPADSSTDSSTGRPRVIALVGPTGVGKTTTVAKLAATYKLRHGKKVGLITSDTYRIAAVDQLKTYAQIIGLPLKVANSPAEMEQAVEALGDCDIVVVDTAGRSQNNTRRLEELAEFTKAAGADETHLVLSTTVGDNVLRKTAQSFKALGPDRCILTKLDEAVTTGPIAGLSDRIGLPLSFITVGQEVPDDLEPARADRLARCVLDGPEAVVRRWSEDNG